MFGSKNEKIRERLEHSGGQRAWAVILDSKFSYSTGSYSGVVPKNMTGHYKVTLRVEPEDGAPFEAIVRAAFPHGTPREGGSIGVIFDPRHQSNLAIYPNWITSDREGSRGREMIAAFLGHPMPPSQS